MQLNSSCSALEIQYHSPVANDASLLNNNNLCSIVIDSLLKKFGNFSNTQAPFLVSKLMASHFATSFIDSTYYYLFNDSPQSGIWRTSCIHNLYALAVIFFGLKKAKPMMELLKLSDQKVVFVDLPKCKGSEFYHCKVQDLFIGTCVSKLNQILSVSDYSNDKQNDMMESLREKATRPFVRHLKPIMDACQEITDKIDSNTALNSVSRVFADALDKTSYDFNKDTWDTFRVELEMNEEFVNQEASFIYCLAILQPGNEGYTTFYHALAVEQLFNPESSTVRYRIYQTWMDTYSLEEYFQMQESSTFGRGTYSGEEFKKILDDLQIIVCKTKASLEVIANAHQDCFGMKSLPIANTWYNADKQILEGASFRYLWQRINPQDCIQNFVSFIESSPELEKIVRQKLL